MNDTKTVIGGIRENALLLEKDNFTSLCIKVFGSLFTKIV